ncbi:phage tail protein X [Chromobacterium alkanivorans]|uniref:Tail protein X n=1 Tax=Chromobacterium haemolyticum TaxID=394935 RepID=A0ABS3GRM5_9NEIS|nr:MULTISPECIES: tail protein X [Chromobacterium]KMN76142.1 membrane protein [Chromobacterium sp. LK11]MBK0416177.1 tail protein X [Chromobacterium haemolyticum]MBN3005993.1 tail protein X [Chromobacterium alkanivorans]MBO0417373.1 tail protein X [Chromobacterium haemolyticum]MBO0500492.1 tail protein X [Chromobacterium haemolyticum]
MFLNHVTQENERWDQIAWRYYGDVGQMAQLIANNAHIPIGETLPAGLILAIPVLEAADSEALEQLPPWRRS